ncbi:MAG: FAD:protein FMN transferase [Thiolinea sp.]
MHISFPFTMPALVLAFFLVFTLSGCDKQEKTVLKLQGQTMGTSWSAIVVPADDSALQTDVLQPELETALKTVNDQMSTWQKDSELSEFNRQQTLDWFPVSKDLAAVAMEAQKVSELSEGIYDTSVGPLVNLWGFGAGKSGEQKIPGAEDIAAAMKNVGYQKLEVRLDPPALRKKVEGLYIDLSSIAKGYGVDQLAAVLNKAGAGDYMVEIGGEIHTKGQSPRGDDWRIAVEKPVALDRMVQQGLLLKQGGLATSGDYRNYFTADGRRYSHTFDPRTGEPVKHSLASVSVLAENTMLADAYATMLMAMGEVKGKAFALEKGIEAYFIWRTDDSFDTFATDGFKAVLVSAED